MRCKSCKLERQLAFGAEMIVHFPGMEGLDRPIVWVFPKLLVCMDCGFTEFAIPETELALLASDIRKSEALRREESAEDITLRDPGLGSDRRTSDPSGGGGDPETNA